MLKIIKRLTENLKNKKINRIHTTTKRTDKAREIHIKQKVFVLTIDDDENDRQFYMKRK